MSDVNVNIKKPIQINVKNETTSLLKREKEKSFTCSQDGMKNDEKNLSFSLHWDYITNKSGDQVFTFTGKELGDEFWKPDTKKKIKVGDLVIFKQKGHVNYDTKARVYGLTRLINKKEALQAGIMEKLPKGYQDEFDLKFIAPPVIAGKRIKIEKGINKKDLEKIPGYRFYFCLKGKKDNTVNKKKLKKQIEREMKKGFVKGLNWKLETILAKNSNEKNVTDLNKQIPQPKDIKYKIDSVNLMEVSDPVYLLEDVNTMDKNISKVRAKVYISLIEVNEKGETKTDVAQNVTSFMNCKWHKERVSTLIEKVRQDSRDMAEKLTLRIGNRLDRAYAKNEYGQLDFYHNKGYNQIMEEYNTQDEKAKKKAFDGLKEQEKKNRKKREEKKNKNINREVIEKTLEGKITDDERKKALEESTDKTTLAKNILKAEEMKGKINAKTKIKNKQVDGDERREMMIDDSDEIEAVPIDASVVNAENRSTIDAQKRREAEERISGGGMTKKKSRKRTRKTRKKKY